MPVVETAAEVDAVDHDALGAGLVDLDQDLGLVVDLQLPALSKIVQSVGVILDVVGVYAAVPTSDMAGAESFYEALIGRPADSHPTLVLAQWEWGRLRAAGR